MAAKAEVSIPYKDMTASQKSVFILKLIVCICTFGLVFPTLGD
jgi:Na+/alanine symporter